jgi:hypothetical protein
VLAGKFVKPHKSEVFVMPLNCISIAISLAVDDTSRA